MTDFATSLATAKATGPGEQRSSIVPELSGLSRTGLPTWSHFMPQERELSEMWIGRKRIETVEEMLNHYQVSALRQAIRLPVHRYVIELDPGELDEEAADRLAADLDVPLLGSEDEQRPGRRANRFSARRHLDRALDALDYGHAVFEQAGRIEDGYWRMTDLAPVPQWTIDDENSWSIDRHGRLIEVIQHGANPPVKIPVDHLVTFTWQGKAGDPRGRSMLRPLTGAWAMSDRTMRVMGMSAERTGMGIPVGKVPTGAVTGAKQKMERLLAGLAAGHDTNLTLETDDDIRQQVMLMGVTGSTPDLVGMLKYYDEAMARAMLAMLLQLGQTEHGSRALGGTFDDLLAMFHDTAVDWYCDTMTQQLVERWVDRNRGEDYLTDGVMPRLTWERRDDEVAAPPSSYQYDLDFGILTVDDRRAQLGLPPLPDGAGEGRAIPSDELRLQEMEARQGTGPMAASRSRGTSASARRALRARQATAATRPTQRRPMAAVTAPTGVMVALYPPPSMAEALALDGGEPASDLHLTLAFLGDADSLSSPEALHAAVRVWAAATPAVTGEVSGVGLFTAGEAPVTYLSLDAPALPQARQDLVDALTAAGLTPSEQHGFTPHITLDYADRVSDVDAAGQMLTFTAVSVVIAGERTDYRLGSAAPVSAATRRQRAARSAFMAVAGRELRREPYPHELAAATDFAQLETQFVAARDDLATLLAQAREDIAAKAIEIVDGLDTVDPLTLGGILGPQLAEHAAAMSTSDIEARLTETAGEGVAQVIGEAARQGVTVNASVDYQERAETEARELLRRIAAQITETVAAAARTAVPAPVQASRGLLGRLRPGRFATTEIDWRGWIGQQIADLSMSFLELLSAGASSRANGNGRFVAIASAPTRAVYASELLDANTCEACMDVDGTEYESVDEAMGDYPAMSSYVACEGMERCRGTIVAVFDSEQATT